VVATAEVVDEAEPPAADDGASTSSEAPLAN